jgi:hypothetical protein
MSIRDGQEAFHERKTKQVKIQRVGGMRTPSNGKRTAAPSTNVARIHEQLH